MHQCSFASISILKRKPKKKKFKCIIIHLKRHLSSLHEKNKTCIDIINEAPPLQVNSHVEELYWYLRSNAMIDHLLHLSLFFLFPFFSFFNSMKNCHLSIQALAYWGKLWIYVIIESKGQQISKSVTSFFFKENNQIQKCTFVMSLQVVKFIRYLTFKWNIM